MTYQYDAASRKFTGQERDAATGLDNFDLRHYPSSVGRFVKPDDPFIGWDQYDPQTLNLDTYARNNPLNNVDDDGHDPIPAATCGLLCRLFNWLFGVVNGHEDVSTHIVSPDPDITSPSTNQMLQQQVPGMNNLTVADLNREGNRSMAEGIKVTSNMTLQFGLMFIFPEADIEEAVMSSERAASPQITAGAQAIAKKLGRALTEGVKSAFEGNPVNQERAAALIRDIMSNPARVVRGGQTTDIYNAAGQGVRIRNGTNEFVGFLEGAKATR